MPLPCLNMFLPAYPLTAVLNILDCLWLHIHILRYFNVAARRLPHPLPPLTYMPLSHYHRLIACPPAPCRALAA